jgi:cell division protein FtsB
VKKVERGKKKKENRGRLKKAVYPLSLVFVVGACAYVLLPGFRELDGVRATLRRLNRLEREKKQHNEALKQEIASMHTSDGIERAARQYLRLAKPDEVIVVFRSSEEEKPTE